MAAMPYCLLAHCWFLPVSFKTLRALFWDIEEVDSPDFQKKIAGQSLLK
jgi:hypothetical protein